MMLGREHACVCVWNAISWMMQALVPCAEVPCVEVCNRPTSTAFPPAPSLIPLPLGTHRVPRGKLTSLSFFSVYEWLPAAASHTHCASSSNDLDCTRTRSATRKAE